MNVRSFFFLALCQTARVTSCSRHQHLSTGRRLCGHVHYQRDFLMNKCPVSHFEGLRNVILQLTYLCHLHTFTLGTWRAGDKYFHTWWWYWWVVVTDKPCGYLIMWKLEELVVCCRMWGRWRRKWILCCGSAHSTYGCTTESTHVIPAKAAAAMMFVPLFL